LALIPVDVSDAEELHDIIAREQEHLRFLSWAAPGPLEDRRTRLQRQRAEFDTGEALNFALRLRVSSVPEKHQSGRLIGGCKLVTRGSFTSVPMRELGYWLCADACGHGYASEAVRALLAVAFALEGVDRVELHADTRNIASIRLAERLGFDREAVLRRRLEPRPLLGPEPGDLVLFSRWRPPLPIGGGNRALALLAAGGPLSVFDGDDRDLLAEVDS